MNQIDFNSINDVLNADFDKMKVSESNLRIAIKTFQENYKNLSEEIAKKCNVNLVPNNDAQELAGKVNVELFNIGNENQKEKEDVL